MTEANEKPHPWQDKWWFLPYVSALEGIAITAIPLLLLLLLLK